MGMRRVMAGRDFDFNRQVVVMAVVNRTRDSFFDRGRTFAHEHAVDAAVAAWPRSTNAWCPSSPSWRRGPRP